MMDVTHSTCRKQREGYLHTRNSSCRTSWDGLSLSALSQSPEHPALDQTPGEKAVKDEPCSSNPDKESILNTEAARKIPFPPFLSQIAGGGLVLLQKGTETNQAKTAHLTQIHDDALVDLLPQVSSENLDQGNLQRGDFAMHEDPCQIQLHLEPNIHLQRKSSCKNTQQHN